MDAPPVEAPPAAAAPPRGRPRAGQLRVAAQAVISLVALAAVVWWALGQEAPSLPRTTDAILWLVGSLGLYLVASLVRAERWHSIVTRAGLAVRRGDTYRLTAVGYMGNNVLPARSGDVLRAFLLAPVARTRKRHVLGTVVAERLLDAATLALVLAVVAYGLLREDVPGGRIVALGALALAALAFVALAAALVIRRRDALRALRDAVRPLSTPTRALASPHGAALLLMSVALWTLEASVYLAIGRSVGIELGLLDALYVVALANLFALVPAAPGYVGTFDAGILFALDSLGATGSQALSYLVLVRFILFVPITVLGLVFLLTRYGGWSRLRAARVDSRT